MSTSLGTLTKPVIITINIISHSKVLNEVIQVLLKGTFFWKFKHYDSVDIIVTRVSLATQILNGQMVNAYMITYDFY